MFCTDGAATVIKSYSPELIVHPYLPDEGAYEAKYANATSVRCMPPFLPCLECALISLRRQACTACSGTECQAVHEHNMQYST